MPARSNLPHRMRVWHRYLGFFLSGVMAMYAITGIVLVFRETDAFKNTTAYAKTFEPGLDADGLGKATEIRRLAIERTQGDTAYFKNGTYNIRTGEAKYVKTELPYLLDKLTKIHKATTNSPLYFLNLFFGAGLLFFVISSFWMYMPGGPILRKGLLFALGGMAVVVILLFV